MSPTGDPTGSGPGGVVLLVDVANVMGSRPDGWWRDRLGAATRLIGSLAEVTALRVDGEIWPVTRILAVVEGRAGGAVGPPQVEVVRAPADGDGAIVEASDQVLARGERALVVTADRGLRARLDERVLVVGPRALLAVLP